MCSAKHAKIGRSGDSVTFCDTSSTNGSYVNGAKVQANSPFVCQPGSVIELAKGDLPVAIARIPDRIATMSEIQGMFESGKAAVEAQIAARLRAHAASCKRNETVYPISLLASDFPFLQAFGVKIEWLSPQVWAVREFGPPTTPGKDFSNPLSSEVELPAGSELNIPARFGGRYTVRIPMA
jgi:predicted component of type VI protein secretion system